MKQIIIGILLITLLNTTSVLADDNDTPPNYSALKQLSSFHIPATDLPSSADTKNLHDCSSSDLYYGFANVIDVATKIIKTIDIPPDYVKARKCALLNMSGSPHDLNDLDILAMLYANGYGVQRNLVIANAIAKANAAFSKDYSDNDQIGDDDAPFDHVDPQAILKLGTNQKLDVCAINYPSLINGGDGVDNPNTFYTCQPLIKKKHAQQYQAKLTDLSLQWTAIQQQKLQQLVIQANLFFDLRSNTESIANRINDCSSLVQMGPSCNAEFELALQQSYEVMQQKMLTDLTNFETKKAALPDFTSTEFKQSDIALNQIYSQVMHEVKKYAAKNAKGPDDSNCYLPRQNVTSDTIADIRKIQQHWLKYRAAWLSLDAARYPEVSADSWNTWLNQERTTQLKNYLNLLQQKNC